ncbi:hypothetical protein HYU40_04405 [Candidatus Woesearchaeota archaeon]|nr:hypothetical protein [Candidatus Woesearchaeota archaeon]
MTGEPMMNTLSEQAQELFIRMMHELTAKLAEQGAVLPRTGLVVADIGAGSMPHAPALEQWALQYCANSRIFAIDDIYTRNPEIQVLQNSAVITPIPAVVEDAKEPLTALGVSKVHLFTMFNPYTKALLPSVAPLERLAEGAPLVGAVATPNDGFGIKAQLTQRGYHVVFYKSPMGDFMRKNVGLLLNTGSNLWSPHDPMFIAMPMRL